MLKGDEKWKNFIKKCKISLENKLMNGSISIFENKIEKIFTDNDNLSEITFDEIDRFRRKSI